MDSSLLSPLYVMVQLYHSEEFEDTKLRTLSKAGKKTWKEGQILPDLSSGIELFMHLKCDVQISVVEGDCVGCTYKEPEKASLLTGRMTRGQVSMNKTATPFPPS